MTYGKKVSPSRKTRIATIKLMQELGSDQSHHFSALDPKLSEDLGIDYRSKALWYMVSTKIIEKTAPDTFRLINPNQSPYAT